MPENEKKRLLVISHVETLRGLLATLLRSQESYEIVTAEDGIKGMERALRERPDLIVLDILTPHIEGYQVAQILRAHSHHPVPIFLLLSKYEHIRSADHSAPPFDVMDFLARVDVLLSRSIPSFSLNPLLGFPGNIDLGRELTLRLSHQPQFAIGYIDLNGLKSYNACYGSTHGDKLILSVRHLLEETLASYGDPHDMLRHISGKNFAFLTRPECVETLCQQMIAAFEREIPRCYQLNSQQRIQIAPLSLTLAVATNREREFTDFIEIGETAFSLQHYLQSLPGSHYAIDRRGSV